MKLKGFGHNEQRNVRREKKVTVDNFGTLWEDGSSFLQHFTGRGKNGFNHIPANSQSKHYTQSNAEDEKRRVSPTR